jgi:hypothetical protein
LTIIKVSGKLKKRISLKQEIIRAIALAGKLSPSAAKRELKSHYPNVYDAFQELQNDNIIEFWYKNKKNPRIRAGEDLYKLTGKGFEKFITEQNLSVREFWTSIIAFCLVKEVKVTEDEFHTYYTLFTQKYFGNIIGSFHSCFFHANVFDDFFKKWLIDNGWSYNNDNSFNSYNHNKEKYENQDITIAQKTLECLALKGSRTIADISQEINVSEEELAKVLSDYTVTSEESLSYYANKLWNLYNSDKLYDLTVDFFNHFIIISKREKEIKYRLSLLGVLLILAMFSFLRLKGIITDNNYYTTPILNYYDKIALNYAEKLPLILGKWGLLKKSLDFETIPSILDYIFINRSQILSLSVLLGGNKEFYDNIHSLSLRAATKIFEICEEAFSIFQSYSPNQFCNTKNYKILQQKLEEIEISVGLTDLQSFAQHMGRKYTITNEIRIIRTNADKPFAQYQIDNQYFVKDINSMYKNELRFIENGVAEEFSLLFYIGLLRYNKHVASDYPLTSIFLRSNPYIVYSEWFLINILQKDKEIKNKVERWINETINCNKLQYDKFNELCKRIAQT